MRYPQERRPRAVFAVWLAHGLHAGACFPITPKRPMRTSLLVGTSRVARGPKELWMRLPTHPVWMVYSLGRQTCRLPWVMWANPSHPEVQAAIEDAIARILKAGKAPGILTPDEAQAKHYLSLGALFVAVGLDTQILVRQTSQPWSKNSNPMPVLSCPPQARCIDHVVASTAYSSFFAARSSSQRVGSACATGGLLSRVCILWAGPR